MRDIVFYFVMLHHGDWNKIYQSIKNKERIDEVKLEEFKRINKRPYLTLLDADYPDCLKRVERPPYLLFYEGDLSLLKEEKRLTVVGTRKMSSYGQQMTASLVRDLVSEGFTIISGLACGVDGVAHRTALANSGKTIAVVANGLDIKYPFSNRELYQEIAEKGLILSEYPDGVPAEPLSFHFRNRLVAGLGQAVLVTEAYYRSGTLITVRHALEQGKDVYCVPARADEKSVCNKLIRDCAYLVEEAKDIELSI